MNDNSFLIGDKVAVSKKYSAINHTEVRQGTIVRQSENSETGEPYISLKIQSLSVLIFGLTMKI